MTTTAYSFILKHLLNSKYNIKTTKYVWGARALSVDKTNNNRLNRFVENHNRHTTKKNITPSKIKVVGSSIQNWYRKTRRIHCIDMNNNVCRFELLYITGTITRAPAQLSRLNIH